MDGRPASFSRWPRGGARNAWRSAEGEGLVSLTRCLRLLPVASSSKIGLFLAAHFSSLVLHFSPSFSPLFFILYVSVSDVLSHFASR